MNFFEFQKKRRRGGGEIGLRMSERPRNGPVVDTLAQNALSGSVMSDFFVNLRLESSNGKYRPGPEMGNFNFTS